MLAIDTLGCRHFWTIWALKSWGIEILWRIANMMGHVKFSGERQGRSRKVATCSSSDNAELTGR